GGLFTATKRAWEQQGALLYRIAIVDRAMAQENADGMIVSDQSENVTHRRLLVDLVGRARIPTVFSCREQFEVGALMVYGPSIADVHRRLAGHVDLILKGTKPGEIPIYLASTFELLISVQGVNALGLTIPTALLVRADEVIE